MEPNHAGRVRPAVSRADRLAAPVDRHRGGAVTLPHVRCGVALASADMQVFASAAESSDTAWDFAEASVDAWRSTASSYI